MVRLESKMILGSIDDLAVIAKSDSDQAIHYNRAARSIASLRSQSGFNLISSRFSPECIAAADWRDR
jgi:hypothetical protein